MEKKTIVQLAKGLVREISLRKTHIESYVA